MVFFTPIDQFHVNEYNYAQIIRLIEVFVN
jgi:hypothetical protein